MLQGGTDLSGSGADSDQFLGIVMGTKASICKIIEHVGCDPIKPDKTTKGRLELCFRLEFDGNDNIAWCIKIDKDRIIQKITKMKKVQRRGIMNKKIFDKYDRIMFNHIRESLVSFALRHKDTLNDITFECDSDCVYFLKTNGLYHKSKKETHVLSDLVAWSNHKGGHEPKGVVVMDIADQIEHELLKMVLK